MLEIACKLVFILPKRCQNIVRLETEQDSVTLKIAGLVFGTLTTEINESRHSGVLPR
jgi:hypothetical protein